MAVTVQALDKRVLKKIEALDVETQVRVRRRIAELSSFPNVAGAKKLQGMKDTWRLRSGSLRILFRLKGSILQVLDVDDRKDVYQGDEPMPRMRRDVGMPRTTNDAARQVQVLIGQNLRAARIHRGLTQKDLATRIGRAQTTVSQAESGRIAVGVEYVRDVLKACGVPKNWSRRHWDHEA